MVNDDENRKPTVRLPATRPGSTPKLAAERDLALIRGETRVQGTRHASLDGRVERVETVLGVPRPAPRPPPATEAIITAPPRAHMKSDAEHAFDAAEGGMIAHTKRLEGSVQVLVGAVNGLRKEQQDNDGDQNAALLLLARELGLEHKLPPALQKSLPPPADAPSGPPLPPVLRRLESRAKRSQLVLLVIAVASLAKELHDIVAWLLPSVPHP